MRTAALRLARMREKPLACYGTFLSCTFSPHSFGRAFPPLKSLLPQVVSHGTCPDQKAGTRYLEDELDDAVLTSIVKDAYTAFTVRKLSMMTCFRMLCVCDNV